MKYGLNLPLSGIDGDARRLVEFARLAEEVGWDGFFIEDNIVYWPDEYRSPTFDPWLVLGAVAAQTDRIRLGTSVTPLSRRRPWKVAREAMTLDHLSNGRCVLGIGLGDAKDPGFAAVGEATEARTRAAMLDEGAAIIDGLWRGEPFSYAGEHYRVNELTLLPRPVQKPRIPIWVGGGWPLPGPTRRAARGDGACLFKWAGERNWVDMTPDDVRAMRADIARHRAADAPFDNFDIIVGGKTPGDDLGPSREKMRALAEAGATWWCEFVLSDFEDGEAMRRRIMQGPPRFD